MSTEPHPRQYRRSILATATVAMATWWGLGLPYSLFAWLLDIQQVKWVLICYAWEVPVAGALGPLLFPLLWFRNIERRWDETFRPEGVDPVGAAALERAILDFPIRVAGVFLLTSLIGYGVGAVQVRVFAELPVTEVIKIMALGLATGLIGALFAFLYLESLLGPLLHQLATVAPGVPPAGRRMPLYVKVFACSIIMTITALLVLGAMLYSRSERVLEEELGRRALGEVHHLALEVGQEGEGVRHDLSWWQQQATAMGLGPSGFVFLTDAAGNVLGGDTTAHRLQDQGFRLSDTLAVLTETDGSLVDRVYSQRIVAFAQLPDSHRHVVAVLRRSDFAAELDGMLQRGAVVLFAGLALALIQGLLFSRRLSRPIEVLTDMATTITQTPGGPWEPVPVRTNDEVGELAIAFNRMTARLEEARAGLERRVAEATRNIATLYEVARTTSSTLEIEDVLALIADKTLATLGVPRLVLLWCPPDLDGLVDAFVAARGVPGERLEVEQTVALENLCPPPRKPEIIAASALPAGIATPLGAERVLRLPLLYKEQLPGVIVAALDNGAGEPDRALAAALASQAAAALANAGLFETVRRKEAELRKLSQMRNDLQEESLRSMSRELHDGIAQVLTVVNMDLGVLERTPHQDPVTLRTRVHEVREQLTSLLQDVRTMSQVLRPSMLDFGLIPTLHWYVEKFMGRTGLTIQLRTPPEEVRLPDGIELMLYRVTQEALTNVAKHAHAHRVEIELTVRREDAVLVIADDGVGFEADRFRRRPAMAGVGLLGMRERVSFYRGTLEIRSRPHAGVRITLRVPLPGDGSERRVVS